MQFYLLLKAFKLNKFDKKRYKVFIKNKIGEFHYSNISCCDEIRSEILKDLSTEFYNKNLLNYVKPYSINYKRNTSDSIKVLHVNTCYGRGGASKIVSQINNALKENIGFESKMLVSESDYKSNNDLVTINSKISNKNKHLLEYQKKEGWLDFFYLSSFDIKNTKAFQSSNIIHYHNLHGGYFSLFALPELTSLKPSVWTIHDTQPITGHCAYFLECDKWLTGCGNCPDLDIYPAVKKDATGFVWENKRKIYENSNLTLVSPSKWLIKILKKSILKDKDIRLIYNGVNEKIFNNSDKNEARKKLDLPKDKIIILFSIHNKKDNFWKGGSYLLRVYEYFKSNKNLLFLNVGGERCNDDEKNWINIPFVHDEEKMALFFASSDIYLHASQAETFGLAVAEAMSCGCSVVAFDVGPIPEIIEHLRSGYIARYKDSDDFINGVKLFIEKLDMRKKVQVEGRKRIEKYFTLDAMTKNYHKLYQEMLN